MNFYKNNGALCCAYKNYEIANLYVRLEYHGTKYNVLYVDSGEWELMKNGNYAVSYVDGVGTFTLKRTRTKGGISLFAVFKADKGFTVNRSFRLTVGGFLPMHVCSAVFNAPFVVGRVHNFEMGSRSYGMSFMKNQKEKGSQYMGFKGTYNGRGGYFGAVGFTTFERYFGEVTLHENGEFQAYANLDDYEICGGDRLQTDKFVIFLQRGNSDVLSLYGKQIAKENGRRESPLPTGWCSWYYYGPNISEQIIRENTQYAKDYALPIKYIQIDDGWQKCYGDWVENDRFAGGMKALADDIRAAGFTPGIWVAPWLFAADSDTFKQHPDWFIKNKNGDFHPNRLIDFSVQGARDWLYDLAHKLSVEWGYRYIKIDLVSWRLAVKDYKKKGFNAVKNFREGLKIMRSAVTDDTVFLTCTSPLGASAGLAEGARISWDIFERWESLKDVAKLVFRRYYIKEYINTDPDCLMVRKEHQHDDEAFRVCVRNDVEIKTFINFMSAASGALMLSDKFALLDEADIEKIRTLFPINPTPAVPLDLYEREIPAVLSYGKRSGMDMYALFNWANTEDILSVSFEKGKYVRGYYGGDYGRMKEFSLTLAPHDSEIIYVADSLEAFEKLGKSIMPKEM